jgi:integrase
VLFACHIILRWGSTPLDDVEAVEVERWLRSLKTVPVLEDAGYRAISAATACTGVEGQIKSRMDSLFEHAKRHKLCTANSIETERQGSKRQIKPADLTLNEIRAIMIQIPNPAIRLAVLVAGATELRRAEIRGLKWQDVDADGHWLQPTQGSVLTYTTNLKTRASGEAIPIPEPLSAAFCEWRSQRAFIAPTPIGPRIASDLRSFTILVRLRPRTTASASSRASWHHEEDRLAHLPKIAGDATYQPERGRVVQELIRHADLRITLELYAQGEEEAKRAAQQHVSGLFVAEKAS